MVLRASRGLNVVRMNFVKDCDLKGLQSPELKAAGDRLHKAVKDFNRFVKKKRGVL